MDELRAKLKSRKFWGAVLALVTIGGAFASHQIDAYNAIYMTVATVGAYCVGEGLADSGRERV